MQFLWTIYYTLSPYDTKQLHKKIKKKKKEKEKFIFCVVMLYPEHLFKAIKYN